MKTELVYLKLIAISLLIFLSACTHLQNKELIESNTLTNIQNLADSDITNHEQVKRGQQLDCAYTVKKGIAVISKVSSSTIYFTFSPGDIEFQLDRAVLLARNITPKKHMEFKATYTSPIDGNKAECPRPDPELIIN